MGDEWCPRRCGISAFGLSGTNCHLVLEEAPAKKKNSVQEDESLHLLTLSAQNENVLIDLIGQYKKWLDNSTDLDIRDICYTANTGRGHYSHRLVMIFKDQADLKIKFTGLVDKKLTEVNVPEIYYGEHKVVTDNKERRQSGELTEKEKIEFSQLAKQQINEIKRNKQNQEKWIELCQLYIRGAEIDWEELYQGETRCKISIPTYPFERKRYWLEAVTPETKNHVEKEIKHPLLDRCLAESIDRKTFITGFSVDRHWVLSEHKVGELYVVPGTTYLEIVREAVTTYGFIDAIELKDIIFISPLAVAEDEVREVQTIIKEEKDFLEFVVASRIESEEFGEGRWIKHTEGKIFVSESKNIKYDLNELQKQCSEELAVNYSTGNPRGKIQTGPRWRNIQRLHLGENQLLAQLELPADYQGDHQEYVLHPAMMDMAVNIASQSIGEGLYLPFSYGSLKLYGAMPQTIYSYLRRKDVTSENLETISFDIALMDTDGNVFAAIEDYRIKKVHQVNLKFGKSAGQEKFYHQINWVTQELEEEKRDLTSKNILIFKDERGIAEEIAEKLKAKGNRVVEVDFGQEYRKIDENHYTISGLEEDYDRLLSEIKEVGLTHILHLDTITSLQEVDDFETLQELQKRGIYSLFYLTRALSRNKFNEEIELVLISDYVTEVTGLEERIHPTHAALVGLGKVVGQEHPNIRCRCIDIDVEMNGIAILSELIANVFPYQVAYRNGQRYVQEFKRVNLEAPAFNEVEIKDQGVYLITGGTGGLGLEIGKYLSSKNKVNLALLNRSLLPSREEWDEVEEPKFIKKITAIREMEENGTTVSCYSTDVTKANDVKAVLDELRAKYGKINGIIHAAGVAGDGFIILKEEDVFDKVIAPKIHGTWILDQLTKDDDLDFFVNFSSINALFGGPGQGDYTAANSYLDSFAYYRRKQGKRTVSINWPAWKETGMAVDYGVNNDHGIFKAISTAQALQVFEEVLNKDLTRVIIGELNYRNNIFDQEQFPIRLAPEIRAELMRWRRHVKTKMKPKKAKYLVEVSLQGREQGDYTETEKVLARVWGDVLGLTEINIYDNFYDLGGDSIFAIKITNNIKEHLQKKIEISDLFEHLTIAELATHLDQGTEVAIKSIEKVAKEVTAIEQVIDVETIHQLSNAQKRIWFLQKFDPEMTAYNLTKLIPIGFELDIENFNQVLNLLINRHSALRSVFREEGGVPKQVILPKFELNLSVIDLSQEEEKELLLKKMVHEENRQAFDLSQPLIRANLYKLDQKDYYLHFTIHHIITDGWSMNVFSQELMELYEANIRGRTIELEPLKIRYVDWVEEQESWSVSEDFKKVENYWLEELAEPLPVLNLPTDFPRPQKQTYNGTYLKFKIDRAKTQKLKEIARQTNSTLHMMLLSSYFLLLNKLSRDEEIVVGIPITGRDDKELERIVGLFVNTICIRIDFSKITTVKDLLEQVKEKSLQAYRYSRYPFDLLVTKINPERDFSRSPIYSTMFQFYDQIPPANDQVSLFELSFLSKEVNEEIEVRLEYNTDLFKTETIERFVGYFTNLVNQISHAGEDKIAEIELLAAEDKERLLAQFSNIQTDEDCMLTVHQLFTEQARMHPDNVAVLCPQEKMTYRELDERSNQLAHLLISEGVQANEPVGILMTRRIEMIVGLLGILKAGGAYVPIDPDYPLDRVSYMLKHSETRIVITEEGLLNRVKELKERENKVTTVIDLIGQSGVKINGIQRMYQKSDLDRQNVTNVELDYDQKNLMYIIYTSGSTGLPKGVMVTHANAVNYLRWSIEDGKLSVKDRMMLITSMSFDISVYEMFGALLSGASLCIVPAETLLDANSLQKYVEEMQVTIWHSVPTLMVQFLMALKGQNERIDLPLRRIMIGGEAWGVELAREIREYFDEAEIVNMYGPTEATIWVTSYKIGSELPKLTTIPIGRPIRNNKVLILDENKKLCGIGIQGDIYVSGANLTNGYYKDEAKTREVFITDEATGEIIYKTGDMGRYLSNGNIEYLGRNDGMVKVRGYRIEVGEIENVMLSNEQIDQVAVITKKEGVSNKLICYYTSKLTVQTNELREYLGRKLPAYMIPAQFIKIEEMPLTPNGKINRKKLVELELTVRPQLQTEYVAPANEVQKDLVNIWQELLETDQIGIHDNFFTLGGNSFLVSQMHARIEEKYPKKVSIVDIFNYSTIFKLAQHINTAIEEKEIVKNDNEMEETEVEDALLKMFDDMEKGEISVDDILNNIGAMEVKNE